MMVIVVLVAALFNRVHPEYTYGENSYILRENVNIEELLAIKDIMNKAVFHVFLVFTFASSIFPSSAIDLSESFKGREWEFMQYKLRTVQNNFRFFKKHKRLGLILLASPTILFSVMTWFAPRKIEAEERAIHTMTAGSIGFFIGFIISMGIEIVSSEIKRANALLRFIKKWPKNKDFTPVCFHDLFEQLYVLYTNEGETHEFKQKIRKFKVLIEQSLDNRFPKEYYNFTTRTSAITVQNPSMFYNPPIWHKQAWQPPTYNNPAIKTWY